MFDKSDTKLKEKFWNIKIKEFITNKFNNKNVNSNGNKNTDIDQNKKNLSTLNNTTINNISPDLSKKFDLFDIGHVLMYLAMGGLEAVNLTDSLIHTTNYSLCLSL